MKRLLLGILVLVVFLFGGIATRGALVPHYEVQSHLLHADMQQRPGTETDYSNLDRWVVTEPIRIIGWRVFATIENPGLMVMFKCHANVIAELNLNPVIHGEPMLGWAQCNENWADGEAWGNTVAQSDVMFPSGYGFDLIAGDTVYLHGHTASYILDKSTPNVMHGYIHAVVFYVDRK